HHRPPLAPGTFRQAEGDGFVMGIEEDVEAVVDDALAARIGVGQRLAVEIDADAASEAVVPVVAGHLLAVRLEPADVADAGAVQRAPHEPAPALEDRVLAAEID